MTRPRDDTGEVDTRVAVVVITHQRRVQLLRTVPRDRVTARALLGALGGIPWVLRERRVLPPQAEARFAALEDAQRRSSARRYVT